MICWHCWTDFTTPIAIFEETAKAAANVFRAYTGWTGRVRVAMSPELL